MTKTDIFNMALRRVGEETIMSLEEDDKNAEVGRLIFEPVYEQCLESHNWKFATFRTHLAETIDTPLFGYNYSYQVPTDPKLLRAIRLASYRDEFKIEGDKILTNTETNGLVYIGYVDDVNKLSPMFVKALYLTLAVEMAYTMVENNTILNGLFQQKEKAEEDARFLDSSNGTADYIDTSDWLDSRDSGHLVNYNKTNVR
jgi:hypothetical protein